MPKKRAHHKYDYWNFKNHFLYVVLTLWGKRVDLIILVLAVRTHQGKND